ncbi:MAG: rhomboid family intramembrane serine protease, partial [Planctomycetota bacterium]
LLVKGIETQVDQEQNKFQLWVKDEDRCGEALEIFRQFKANPTDPRYLSSVDEAKEIVRTESKKRQKMKQNMVRVNPRNIARKPMLTIVMIVACIFVSVVTEQGDGKPDSIWFKSLAFAMLTEEQAAQLDVKSEQQPWQTITIDSIDRIDVRLASVMRGEVWRVITPIFIHFGVIHILFNMIWLYQFGQILENKYGTFRFGLLVLFTAAVSNILQCIVPIDIGGSAPIPVPGDILITRLGGMSGVVYGLFGFFWMKSKFDRRFEYRITQSTIYILIGSMIFFMLPADFNMGLGGSIANWAHGAGLASGMAVGYLTSPSK